MGTQVLQEAHTLLLPILLAGRTKKNQPSKETKQPPEKSKLNFKAKGSKGQKQFKKTSSKQKLQIKSNAKKSRHEKEKPPKAQAKTTPSQEKTR